MNALLAEINRELKRIKRAIQKFWDDKTTEIHTLADTTA